jgi:SnoaL-like polyketide cyclase
MPLDPVAYRPYRDPDDFIREVTDRIWVHRDISYIVDNYEPDSIVHGGLGTVIGRDGVIEGSLLRIAATPQHVGQAEDVVWEARGDDAFLSSHLVFSSNQQFVEGRPVQVRRRGIANCLYRRGRMVEEWVVRDELGVCLQRGGDPDELGRQFRFRGYEGSMTKPAPTDVLTVGDSGPRPDEYRPECEMVLEFIEQVWNRRRLHKVPEFMERDLFLHTVGDRSLVRPDGYQRELLSLIAPSPDAQFAVRDLQTHYAERYAGLRVAVLWVMHGTYHGAPVFGPLTNGGIDLLGVSQFLIQRGRIVREMRLYDEIALRAQINATRGDVAFTDTNIY